MASATDAAPVPEFNYEDTKQKFVFMQTRYVEKNSQAIEQPGNLEWTRDKVDRHIAIIRGNDVRKFAVIKYCDVIKEFAVIKENGKIQLVKKIGENEQRIVIPYDECFDAVLVAHRLYGHRGLCRKTYQYISNKYLLDKIWLVLLTKVCNICNWLHDTEVHENSNLTEFKQCYRIFTTKNLPVIHDQNQKIIYQSLLIVVDMYTNFVFLRPLMEPQEHDIAVELFKIFSDYGLPKLIEVRNVGFYENVCRVIRTFEEDCNVPVSSMPIHHTDWSLRATLYLQEWMTFNCSQNWVMGCQVVQWNMNNVIKKKTKRSPYEEVFHAEPTHDLNI